VTIAEKLQIVAEQKANIKTALENQGKAPTDALSTYAGLIDDLENPENIVYCVTTDGTDKTYTQLQGEQEVTLTATANDIRENTSAITNGGYTEGSKKIPSYQSRKGVSLIQANTAIVYKDSQRYDFTKFQATLALFNSSISESVQVDRVTVDEAVYTANSTEKLADISIDHANTQIDFGITNGDTIAVMRFFIMREEA
jgi:hypothetical protein